MAILDLAEFGEAFTPNQHNLARNFVTLDNFYDTAEVSYDGWPWTTSARAPDVVERQFPVAYAGRGLSLDTEGVNRNVNVAYATLAERQAANPLTPDDPDLLPGQTDVAAPDGPNNEVNTGYLWDSALRAKLTVRNYGFFVDTTRYVLPAGSPNSIPLLRDPPRNQHDRGLPGECRPRPVHRSVLPRFRQLVSGLLPLQGVGARVRHQIRQSWRRGTSFLEPRSLHARSHRKLRYRD